MLGLAEVLEEHHPLELADLTFTASGNSLVRRTVLPSGVRILSEAVPGARSSTIGYWVAVGSRDEHPETFGSTHFLEHLLFKGTPNYSAIEISERFDGLGASFNAATSKETTHLYARFLDEHTDEVFDLLGEMLLESTFPDIDSERDVVLEEIAMYEDEPSDRVHDYLADAIFGDTPLGRRILGRAEVIAEIPVPDIAAYHRSRYTSDNIVVAAAGNLDHDAIVAMAEKLKPDQVVVYKTVGDRKLEMHVFEPKGWKAGDARACFVTIHGGGWTGGTPPRMYPFAKHFADLGMVGINRPVAPHLQPQPAHAALKVQLRRARAGVPGGEQPGSVFAHKGAVARAHQRLGIRYRRVDKVFEVAAAAGAVGKWTSAKVGAAAGARGIGVHRGYGRAWAG